MRRTATALPIVLALIAAPLAFGQSAGLTVPPRVEAGSAFTIESSGSGKATLFIVGPDQVLKKDVDLGQPISFAAGALYNAGHYIVFLTGAGANDAGSLDVVPVAKPAKMSFLARPSRLPVGLHDGITGAVYLFDSYRNLITQPTPVSFELATPNGTSQTRSANAQNGAAWIAMDSSPKEGAAQFVARAGDVSTTRVIGQVPGDPCRLNMSAKPAGPQKVEIETDPVRDCSGNPVPDGTIVTFTETYNGSESTADVPLKRGVAKVEMPAHPGATISVASGVVLGNQIRWGK